MTPSGADAPGIDPHPGVRSGQRLPAGERAADLLCRAGGSWAYVSLVAAGIAVAAVLAVPGGSRSVTLVGLGLSALAALEVAVALMASRRAGRIAAEIAQYQLDQGRRAGAAAEELRADMGRLYTELARIAALTEIARGSTRSHP
ncbi:MAG TPA: hypothetical protein VGP36_12925 [Mycobacteriales bacterium]|nr:hypothetical protein [Mycobacteriales bacterium]